MSRTWRCCSEKYNESSMPKYKGGRGLAADVAPAAPLQALPEVLEQHPASATPPLHVRAHGGGHAPGEVPRSPEQDAVCDGPIAPAAPRLLVVALERARRPPVDHAAHVRLV